MDVINFLTVSVVNKKLGKSFLKAPLTLGMMRALSVLHCETESHRSHRNCKRQV